MKLLLILILGAIVLTGCASNPPAHISEEDRWLWNSDTNPPPAGQYPR